MGNDRPSVYREDDMWVIRASALGGCMRSLVAAGRDVEPHMTPEWMQEKFDEGHAGENAIRQWFQPQIHEASRVAGHELYRDGDQWGFDLTVAPGIIVRGHLDDLNAEYKLLAQSTFDKAVSKGVECLPTYPWQVACYMFATGQEGWHWVSVLKDENGHPDFDHTHKVWIDKPPRTADQIRERAVEIVDWVENREYDEYPDCPAAKQYPCPYFLLHEDDEPVELTGDKKNIMKAYLGHLDFLKARSEATEVTKKLVQGQIRDLLNDVGEKTVTVDGTRVTWVHTETPEHWVTPKAYMKKASTSDYPKITPPKNTNKEA